MKTAILLDWDGVLCDSLRLYYDFYIESCRRHQHPFPIKDLDEFRAWYNPRWEENYYELGFTEEEFQEVLEFWKGFLQYSKASLFPGVPENLARWSQEFPLAIVSTTPSWMIRERLRQDDLEKYFVHFTGGEDGCSEKREKLKNTLQQLGIERGVMVGDTPLDIDAGKYNGLQTVGVTYGWVTPTRILEAEPHQVVRDPLALGDAVLELARA